MYDLCEVQPGKILNGGSGRDKLIIPVSADVLRSQGIIITGFENIVVDTSNAFLSDCF